jgi:anti-sigma regulatory factor (Ser/Thr protein kinase)
VVQQLSLKVTTRLEELATVLGWFNRHYQPQLSRQTLIECQTLLAEGFTNAVQHAHRDQAPQTPIEIELSLLGDQIELRIWDRGPTFDLEQRMQNHPEKPASEAMRGRGLQIIASLADSFSYHRFHDRNCLQITKTAVLD